MILPKLILGKSYFFFLFTGYKNHHIETHAETKNLIEENVIYLSYLKEKAKLLVISRKTRVRLSTELYALIGNYS